MKHKNSHLLVGYWSRIRKGRDVPDQTDLDPRAIKRMLPYVFLLDAEDPSRPIYRLAGTALCERFGFELKGTGFLAHWEAQSSVALTSLLRQALRLKQPVCLTSIGASADCGMVELETILAPVTFGPGEPTRFIGMIQILSDASQLHGRPIAFQRLAASQLIHEDEPASAADNPPPPPPALRSHPKAPHLRLVVSQDEPAAAHFDSGELMAKMFDVFGKGLSAS
ncbi:MAG: PAS domain-containing protein [Alphaproteobacteria bacterium]|nr:PAS domain-containing protein [Alphaproteobacteria bacterium]